MATARLPRQRGFTLIEMMVVIIIIGVLSTVALLSVRSESYGDTVQGFGREIVAEIDLARMRAVATGKWQQLEIEEQMVTHWEATTQGMGAPVAYDLVRRIVVPRNVLVVATDNIPHLEMGISPPTAGAGLPTTVNFAPDGSADRSATIFLNNAADDDPRRVAIIRATGTAYVFNEW